MRIWCCGAFLSTLSNIPSLWIKTEILNVTPKTLHNLTQSIPPASPLTFWTLTVCISAPRASLLPQTYHFPWYVQSLQPTMQPLHTSLLNSPLFILPLSAQVSLPLGNNFRKPQSQSGPLIAAVIKVCSFSPLEVSQFGVTCFSVWFFWLSDFPSRL